MVSSITLLNSNLEECMHPPVNKMMDIPSDWKATINLGCSQNAPSAKQDVQVVQNYIQATWI